MIKNSIVEIEGADERIKGLMFKLTVFDEYTANLKIDTLVNKDNIDNLFISVKKAIELMELEDANNDKR